MKKPQRGQTTTLPEIMFTSSSLPTRVYIHTGTSMVTAGHSKGSNDSPTLGAVQAAKSDQKVQEMNDTPKARAAEGKTDQKTEQADKEFSVKDVQRGKSKSHGNGTKVGHKKQVSDNVGEISPDLKESLKLPQLQQSSRSPSLTGTPNLSPRKSTPSISPRLSGDKGIDAGKDLYTQVLQKARKSRSPEKSHPFPDVKIKYLDKREDTKDMMKNQEMIPIPFSHIDRKVTVVRNAMYGNFLRKSTKKLQDDLRQTMRVYSSEKHELLRHLASLRHEMDELKASESSSSPTSSFSDSSSFKSTPRFFHAPNLAANKARKKGRKRKNSLTSDDSMGSQNQKIKEGILRLPTIKDASPAPQEWESGNSMHTNLPPIEHPKGLATAKALLDNNFSIPKISDPSREDISVASLRQSNREKKKVHFSEENKITEFEVIRYNENEAKNWRHGGANSPTEYYRKPRGSKKGKGERGGSKGTLAPLKRPNDPKEAQKVAAEYKSLYLSIHDPEERTKTLADILYAVRMRMQENEQNLKFGESPRPAKTNNTLCDFLLSNSSEDPILKGSEPSKLGNKFHGAPNHTAARIGRRSHSIQLQNYLRKMSKSRRMIEHMEAEQYRLAHIIGHKHLMAASQAAQA
ncbi:uncharacterized protein LOC117336289 [Pecten maximus]|uniref:uncharacterized protein LOC117336289 n=1 Tax=Pecten maximus TaxID=6579 RepID=UPI0014589E3D|nr:uncharacterized protein LOC117336289 [Pecten maximus]XP_033752668.1 uncharacterized protein LOC117336289 [Pecten maximus]XP_033752669.1 uncharacterized protein LOC117336289 [Pecten maximus]XP_033752670.1 uncharacterized protein LOC117336289 [Pecten maximus]